MSRTALVSSAALSDVRVIRRWIALLLIAVLASCDDDAPTAPPDDEPPGVTVESSGPIFWTLQVSLAAPAAIQADYWSSETPRLRVTSPVEATQHSLFLPRLRSGTTYEYEVQLLGASDDPLHAGQFETGPLPPELAWLQFTATGTPTFPLTMLEARSPPLLQFVLDEEGEIVWYRSGKTSQGFTRLADGAFVFNERTGISVETADHRVVARLDQTGGMGAMHHDVITTPENTLLFLTQLDQAVGDSTLTGEAIWEWDPETGELAQRWSAFDFFDPSEDLGYRSRRTDWLHANSLSIGPRGNILVSFFWLHEVTSIAADYKSLEWRLGGPNSSFTGDSAAMAAGQHTAVEVSPGRVLLFDNGLDRPDSTLYSHAFEIELNPEGGTAGIVWEFRPDPDIYTPIMSSARRLDSGNNLVLFGLEQGTGVFGRVSTGPLALFEVTPSEEVVWSIHLEGLPRGVYRATPLTDVGGEELVQ